jgi:F0F1-type ATP synthase assembly protein I
MTTFGNGAGKTATRKAVSQRAIMAKQARAQEHASRANGLDTGWTVFSYMISGMVAYGGIGWLIGRAVHVGLLFPLGMVAGLGISVGFIIYRFGRQASVERRFGAPGSVEHRYGTSAAGNGTSAAGVRGDGSPRSPRGSGGTVPPGQRAAGRE